MSGSRRVLTTQTSSSPFEALSVATGESADGDAITPVAQQHTTAITVRAREVLSAAKRRKTDTERMEDQPVPRRGYSSTVLNSSTRFRASDHVFSPANHGVRTVVGWGEPTQSLPSCLIGKVVAVGCDRQGNFLEKSFRPSDRVADRELGFGRRRRGRRIVSDRGSLQT